MPIRLKVRFFDDEVQLVVYNTLSLFLLLQKLADVTSMPSNSFKVKAIEQQRIFRIDNKAENDEIKATISLKDLEIYDGTPLMIELKEEGDDVGADEAQPEAQDDAGDGQSQAKPKEEHVLLDDTPNLRTALVEKANEALDGKLLPGLFNRYGVPGGRLEDVGELRWARNKTLFVHYVF